jgi:hypothetical protein
MLYMYSVLYFKHAYIYNIAPIMSYGGGYDV